MNRTVTAVLLGDPPPCLEQRRREAEDRAKGGHEIKTMAPRFGVLKGRGKWK